MSLAYLQLLNYCIALAVNISSPMRALLVFPIKSHGNEVMNELDPKRGQREVWDPGWWVRRPFWNVLPGWVTAWGLEPGGVGVKLGWERGEKILVGECRRGCGGLDCWTEDRKCSFELKLGATHLETGQLCYLSISANILRCLVLWEYSLLTKTKMLTVMIKKRCRWW